MSEFWNGDNMPEEEREQEGTPSESGGELSREAVENQEIQPDPEAAEKREEPLQEEFSQEPLPSGQAEPIEPVLPEGDESEIPQRSKEEMENSGGVGDQEPPAQPQPAPWPGQPYPPQQPYYPVYPQPSQGYQQPYPQPWPGQPVQQPQPGYPPYGYGPYGEQRVQVPQPYYPAPVYYGGYNGFQPRPVQPPKKKMSRGLKIFLWITGVLSVIAIIGGGVYLALAAVHAAEENRRPSFGYDIPDPREDEEEPRKPSENEGGDEEEEQPERPQVDVTPNTDGIHITERPGGETLDAEGVYNRVVPSTVTVSATLTREGNSSESTGTGIIATSDGYIITNSHVVLNSKNTVVKVTAYDGQEYDAVVVGVDRTTDLAVLKTNDHNFTPAEFGDAGELSVGEWVLAIGNPGGARFSSSLTRGIISGLNREVGKYSQEGMTYIQTDAAINPGNSGGPLVNMYGQVVGINSSKIITDGYEGMGFAIPVSRAQPIINELLSGGYIKGRTRLGILCTEVNQAMAGMYGIPRGLRITEFNEDSSFQDTEAQVGDVIVAIEGETVESLRDVSNLLLRYAPGDEVTVTLYRPNENFMMEGQEIEVTIVLLEDKGETQN